MSWNSTRLSGLRIMLSDAETGSIEVSVTTAGVPGEDSVVWAGAVGGMGDIIQRGRTDRSGRYRLDGLSPGVWGVTAVYPGQTSSWQRRIVVDCEVIEGRTTEVSVDFQVASASLEGTVTLDGESATGGNIMLTLIRPGESETYSATWTDKGIFTIVDIVPGAGTLGLNVVFGENRRRSKAFDLEFVEGESKVIEIDLSGGQTLTGVMHGLGTTEHGGVVALRGEHEITEVTLEWFTAIQSFAVGAAIVAADGSYSVEGLELGMHTIVATVTKTLNSDAFDDVRWTSYVMEVSDTGDNTVDFDMR